MSALMDSVARAMAAYAASLPKTSNDAPFIYAHRQELARVAVAALREPSDAMLACAHNGDWHGGIEGLHDAEEQAGRSLWQAMIDAALSEPT